MPELDDVIPGITDAGDDGEAEPREPVESEVAEQEGDTEPEPEESVEETPAEEESEEEVEESEEIEEEESEETEEESEEEPGPAPAPRRKSREAELSGKLKEYEPFAPLIDILKEDPNLVREIVAKKLGLAPQAPIDQGAPAPTGKQMTAEELNAEWNKRLAANPAQALNDLIAGNLERIAGPQQKATVTTIIRGYKSDRRADDDLFSRYENYFDALVSRADPRLIMANPEQALGAIEATALGIFAREQRQKVRTAKAKSPANQRENPRRNALENPRGVVPKGQGPKPARKLTSEEQILADRYGADALDTSDDSESAWG